MPECDLDDNDPLSVYVKKAPMVGAMKAPAPTTNNTRSRNLTSMPRDNKTDSISDVMRQRSENINHGVTDTENDKTKETEVSKQMD